MCFTRTGKMQVATKAILCYKGLFTNEKRRLISPYKQHTVWKVRERKVENKLAKNSRRSHLSFGFHSTKTPFGSKCHSTKVYSFIIPKGALYYENRDEYISNEIYLKSAKPVAL